MILKRTRVGGSADRPAATALRRRIHCGEGRDDAPVQILEEDGRVHALEIRCACGERITVALDYPDESAPAVEDGSPR